MPVISRLLLLGSIVATATGQQAAVRPGFHLFFGNGGSVTLERPPLPAADEPFTVECWIKSDARPKKPTPLVSVWPDSKKHEDGLSLFTA